MRVVLAPDSFKGSLSATAVCRAMAEGILRAWPAAELLWRPMADGGEGTLEAIAAAGHVVWRQSCVSGFDGKPVEARWLWREGIAILETAEVVGLHQVGDLPLAERSSRGVGELITAALDAGAREIWLGLGGTGCNDGGAGCLAALGLRLLDAHGQALPATLAGLAHLARLDWRLLDPRLQHVRLVLMSDVTSPLCGPQGATFVFGPQKGADAADLATFDARLAHWAQQVMLHSGVPWHESAGAGAAGGLGFALLTLGGEYRSGSAAVAALNGLAEALTGAQWVLTGEGRTDQQTTLGKAPWRVAELAAEARVPVTLLSGAVDRQARTVLAQRFAGYFSICNGPQTLDQARSEAAVLVADAAESLTRLFMLGGRYHMYLS